jgi:aspartate/glutamate racemase
MDPVQDTFRRLWPEAICTNLLDDALSPDLERDGVLTAAMTARIGTLADYATGTGADGILFTCSAFGAAIEQAAARLPIPVLKPNEAMFDAALDAGDEIGMLATFAPAVAGMEEEFRELARARGRDAATIRTVCVPEAMAALRSGDAVTHNGLLAQAALAFAGCDVVLLAHFSTSRAEQAVSAAVSRPVQTSPAAAVRKLRDAIAVGRS